MRVHAAARFALALFGALSFPAGAAAAPPGDGGGPDDVDELVRAVDRAAQTLSTDDCSAACNALASMRRAAERLCSLDPGQRCADARRTVDEASRKVRAACPQCAVAMQPPMEEQRMPAKTGGSPNAPPPAPEPTIAARAESGRGGCASCSSGGGAGGDAAAWMLAVALVLARRSARRAR
jgi:hypothetical protein